MIKQYVYGNPLNTEAVVIDVPASTEELCFFKMQQQENGYELTYQMDRQTQLYGLGENVRGMNKRGFIYKSHCSDDPNHDEGKNSLYGAHNFLVVKAERTFGIFIDFPGNITFDLGYGNINQIHITIFGNDFKIYIIEEPSLIEVSKSFRKLIGQSYVPPKWAFGYQQSRWSYQTEAEVLEVVRRYKEAELPLDAVYLDIDYMEGYKDFTVDKEAFPNLKDLSEKLLAEGIHLVPIIDAGVKIEKDYEVYEEGVAGNYFCKDEKGKDFVAAVWPGKVHFPDFFKPEVRDWFGKKYKFLLDQSIEGFWNDMNEPAIFYSEEGLKEAFSAIDQIRQLDNMDVNTFFYFKDVMGGISNSPKDYASFYHEWHGEKVRHDRVHNLYGYYMTRAAGEAIEEMSPRKRILLFSRASYIGMHRYGGIWTGDNKSWWSHLLMNIQMMPNLNMCGFLYTGADIGGFGDHTTEDLLLRWLAFGVFTPLMRNHSAIGTRQQEAYAFSQTKSFKNILDLRYCLLPYIYSEYMKAVINNELYFRPLAFDYPEDEMAGQIEDQLLVGEAIMIAPVYTQNAKGRYVYLPEKMLMVKFKGNRERTYELVEQGHHYIEIALEEVVIFVKPNHFIPLGSPAQNITQLDESTFELCGYIVDQATYALYQDDGETKFYENDNHYTTFNIERIGNQYQVNASKLFLNLTLKLFS